MFSFFFFLDEKMKKKFKAFVEELRKNGATRYDISTMKKEKRKVLHRNVITWLTHIFKVKQPKIIYIIKKKKLIHLRQPRRKILNIQSILRCYFTRCVANNRKNVDVQRS